MEKIKKEEIIAYLAYSVQYAFICAYDIEDDYEQELSIFDGSEVFAVLNDNEHFLLLNPMSNLTREIEHGGERFVPIEKLSSWLMEEEPESFDDIASAKCWLVANMCFKRQGNGNLPYKVVSWLLEHHFDVFDLIQRGKAIDKNTL